MKKNPTVDFKVKKSSVSDIFRTYEESDCVYKTENHNYFESTGLK